MWCIVVCCVALWCNVVHYGALWAADCGSWETSARAPLCAGVWGWGVVQCGAVCCSVVQHVAVWCSDVQHVAVWCSVVQHVAAWCGVVQHGAAWCSVVPHVAAWCSMVQYDAVCCGSTMHTRQHTAPYCTTLHHAATQCNALQCTATHCNTLQHTAKVQNIWQTFQKRPACTLRLILLDDIYVRRDLYSDPPLLSLYTRARTHTQAEREEIEKEVQNSWQTCQKRPVYNVRQILLDDIYIKRESYIQTLLPSPLSRARTHAQAEREEMEKEVQNLRQTCQKRHVYNVRQILLDDIYIRRDLWGGYD